MLQFNPTKRDRGADDMDPLNEANDDYKSYDMLFREMAYETNRVRATDRTKSQGSLLTSFLFSLFLF